MPGDDQGRSGIWLDVRTEEIPMEKHRIGSSMRFFFFVVGSIIWLGLWFTGFARAHWLLYVPPLFFYFAAATAICPGMIIARMLFPEAARREE
jgi:hypothetical protein